jgi:Mce-associated membrane protein
VIDADSVAPPPQDEPEQRSADSDEALVLAEEAEAEAAEAEAIAAAARARAKALRLRRQAAEAQASERASEPVTDNVAEPAEDTEPESGDTVPTEDVDETEAPSKRRRMPRIRWKIVAAVSAIVLTLAFVAASGYMVWHHRLAQQEQQRTAEFTAAARQSVVTLMSLNFNNAQEDVQRIIENSTGQFREDFEAQAEDFTQVAKDSKVVTEVTVNVASLKSVTDNNATALVSATSRVTNTAGANQEPRSWRLMVDLVREGDQIKMSKVEFVP